MADDVRVTNWPNADGSEAAAVIKLWEYLRSADEGPKTIDEHLALVRRCRAAIKGVNDPGSGVSTKTLEQARSRVGGLA